MAVAGLHAVIDAECFPPTEGGGVRSARWVSVWLSFAVAVWCRAGGGAHGRIEHPVHLVTDRAETNTTGAPGVKKSRSTARAQTPPEFPFGFIAFHARRLLEGVMHLVHLLTTITTGFDS